MVKLIKVSAFDCPVCTQMAYYDVSVAEDYIMAMEVIELGDLASSDTESDLRQYVMSYHLYEDGSVTLPIYVIVNDGNIQASGEVKDEEELRNLVDAWQQWRDA